METKHVVMFSTGAGSAFLAKYVIDKYGKDNTILLITDTKWEDIDNYRFMNDVSNYLNKDITCIQDGRTPKDIFKEDLYFGNFGTAPCSKELKMKQTFDYIQNIINNGIKPILYFGIEYSEARRAPRIAHNYKHNVDVFEDGIEVCFPLIGEIDGEPVGSKQLLNSDGSKPPKKTSIDIQNELDNIERFVPSEVDPKKIITEEWKVKLPRMYELGFEHANCAGRCIKGGFKHFETLYNVWPESYKEMEELEKEIMEERISQGKRPYTILGKQIKQPNGSYKKTPYSLERFRKESLEVLENKEQLSLFDQEEDSTPCPCIF